MSKLIAEFKKTVSLHSQETAIVAKESKLTYQEFSNRVNRLHDYLDIQLKKNTSGENEIIGISLEKDEWLYISIFSIMLSKCAYVPIDPNLSENIKNHIIKSSNCKIIINKLFIKNFLKFNEESNYYSSEIVKEENPNLGSSEDRISYIIFTSGTTGKPKGVAVSESSLVNLIDFMRTTWNIGPGKKVLQYSTVNFDASIMDIFPTLLSGASLHIPTQEQVYSLNKLVEYCNTQEINHVFFPPSLLTQLRPKQFSHLKVVLTGGEPLDPETQLNWSRKIKLYNLYGPTECTVFVTFKELKEGVSNRNIGKCIPNTHAYIINEFGEISNRGELYIAGKSLSKIGYINNPKETADKFKKIKINGENIRVYKTGDIVEIKENNELYFIGRSDRQIKLRGFRIELEEIEFALKDIGISEVAVKVIDDKIVAFISNSFDISIEKIKSKLSLHLPEYKIPQLFSFIQKFPYKLSGKIDYSALSLETNKSDSVEKSSDKKFNELSALWSEVLSIPVSEIKMNSNFKTLGGSSINIMTLLSLFETKFGIKINYLEFFKTPDFEFLYTKLLKHEEYYL